MSEPVVRASGAPEVALDRTFTYRLHLLHKISDQQTQQTYAAEAGLSMSDGRCLATIGSFEPLSVKDLARYANLDKGQASRAAQALVDQGLVKKKDSAEDGRGVTLSLSAAGRRVWVRTMALIQRRNEEIFGCLSAGELHTLDRLLDRLIEHNSRA